MRMVGSDFRWNTPVFRLDWPLLQLEVRRYMRQGIVEEASRRLLCGKPYASCLRPNLHPSRPLDDMGKVEEQRRAGSRPNTVVVSRPLNHCRAVSLPVRKAQRRVQFPAFGWVTLDVSRWERNGRSGHPTHPFPCRTAVRCLKVLMTMPRSIMVLLVLQGSSCTRSKPSSDTVGVGRVGPDRGCVGPDRHQGFYLFLGL